MEQDGITAGEAGEDGEGLLAVDPLRLQQVLDVVPEAMVIADGRGRIVMSNRAARAIWGSPSSDDPTDGERFSVWYPDGTPCPWEAGPMARSLRHGQVVRAEPMQVRSAATGRQVRVLASSAPLRDPDGAISGAVAVFQDIGAIEDLERHKDEFLAAVSHDLQNPLAVIKGFAQQLRRRAMRAPPPTSEELARVLTHIDSAVTRMAGLLDGLVDAARRQMGGGAPLDLRPADLVALVHRGAGQASGSRRHRLRVQADVPELVGMWDAVHLERMIGNLVSNALKYSPDGGPVTLAVRQERQDDTDWAVLYVRDEGLGIPADEVPRVFERFYRARNVAGVIEGTGLGLTGVSQIIDQHGGKVSVESDEASGSTFTVRLPLRNGAPSA